MIVIPKNPLQLLSQLYLPESWITKCCSKIIYETLAGKVVMYVMLIHPREAACGSGCRCWDHPVLLLQRLQQRCSLPQPRSHQRWLQQGAWRRLPDVHSESLRTWLVKRPLKWNEVQCVPCAIKSNLTLLSWLKSRISTFKISLHTYSYKFSTYKFITAYYYIIITYYCIMIMSVLCHYSKGKSLSNDSIFTWCSEHALIVTSLYSFLPHSPKLW